MYKKHLSNISYLRSMHSFVNILVSMLMTIILWYIRSLARSTRIIPRMMKLNIKIPMWEYILFHIVLIRRKFYLINILNSRFPNLSGYLLSLILLTSAKIWKRSEKNGETRIILGIVQIPSFAAKIFGLLKKMNWRSLCDIELDLLTFS